MSFNDQGKSGDYRHLFDEYPFIVHVYGLSFIICSVALLLYYNGRNKPAIRMRRPLLCIAHTSALLVKGYAFVIVPAWGADSCPCLVHLFCYYVAPVCSFWLYVIRLYMIVLQCNKQAWHLQHYYKSEGLIEDKHFQPLRTIKQSTTICGKLIFDIKWNKSMSSYPRWTKVTFVVYLLVFVALLTGHVRANGFAGTVEDDGCQNSLDKVGLILSALTLPAIFVFILAMSEFVKFNLDIFKIKEEMYATCGFLLVIASIFPALMGTLDMLGMLITVPFVIMFVTVLHLWMPLYISYFPASEEFHRPIEYKDLPSLLSTRMGMRSFAYYLASEFQVERLLFFFAVQKYKNSCTHLMRLRSFSELYSQFVPINAPKDLLLPSTVQDHLSMEISLLTKALSVQFPLPPAEVCASGDSQYQRVPRYGVEGGFKSGSEDKADDPGVGAGSGNDMSGKASTSHDNGSDRSGDNDDSRGNGCDTARVGTLPCNPPLSTSGSPAGTAHLTSGCQNNTSSLVTQNGPADQTSAGNNDANDTPRNIVSNAVSVRNLSRKIKSELPGTGKGAASATGACNNSSGNTANHHINIDDGFNDNNSNSPVHRVSSTIEDAEKVGQEKRRRGKAQSDPVRSLPVPWFAVPDDSARNLWAYLLRVEDSLNPGTLPPARDKDTRFVQSPRSPHIMSQMRRADPRFFLSQGRLVCQEHTVNANVNIDANINAVMNSNTTNIVRNHNHNHNHNHSANNSTNDSHDVQHLLLWLKHVFDEVEFHVFETLANASFKRYLLSPEFSKLMDLYNKKKIVVKKGAVLPGELFSVEKPAFVVLGEGQQASGGLAGVTGGLGTLYPYPTAPLPMGRNIGEMKGRPMFAHTSDREHSTELKMIGINAHHTRISSFTDVSLQTRFGGGGLYSGHDGSGVVSREGKHGYLRASARVHPHVHRHREEENRGMYAEDYTDYAVHKWITHNARINAQAHALGCGTPSDSVSCSPLSRLPTPLSDFSAETNHDSVLTMSYGVGNAKNKKNNKTNNNNNNNDNDNDNDNDNNSDNNSDNNNDNDIDKDNDMNNEASNSNENKLSNDDVHRGDDDIASSSNATSLSTHAQPDIAQRTKITSADSKGCALATQNTKNEAEYKSPVVNENEAGDASKTKTNRNTNRSCSATEDAGHDTNDALSSDVMENENAIVDANEGKTSIHTDGSASPVASALNKTTSHGVGLGMDMNMASQSTAPGANQMTDPMMQQAFLMFVNMMKTTNSVFPMGMPSPDSKVNTAEAMSSVYSMRSRMNNPMMMNDIRRSQHLQPSRGPPVFNPMEAAMMHTRAMNADVMNQNVSAAQMRQRMNLLRSNALINTGNKIGSNTLDGSSTINIHHHNRVGIHNHNTDNESKSNDNANSEHGNSPKFVPTLTQKNSADMPGVQMMHRPTQPGMRGSGGENGTRLHDTNDA